MRHLNLLGLFLALLTVASGCTSFDQEAYQISFNQVKQSAENTLPLASIRKASTWCGP